MESTKRNLKFVSKIVIAVIIIKVNWVTKVIVISESL